MCSWGIPQGAVSRTNKTNFTLAHAYWQLDYRHQNNSHPLKHDDIKDPGYETDAEPIAFMIMPKHSSIPLVPTSLNNGCSAGSNANNSSCLSVKFSEDTAENNEMLLNALCLRLMDDIIENVNAASNGISRPPVTTYGTDNQSINAAVNDNDIINDYNQTPDIVEGTISLSPSVLFITCDVGHGAGGGPPDDDDYPTDSDEDSGMDAFHRTDPSKGASNYDNANVSSINDLIKWFK